MSPEQSAALELDARSDIFSIGICLYEALTYKNPFAKGNAVLSLDAIQRQDPPPLAEFRPEYAVFQEIIDKALAKNRDDRFQTCREFGVALRALIENSVIDRHPISLQEYMNEVFHQQIIEEKRMILETDSATTRELSRMREEEAARRGFNLDATIAESDAHKLLQRVADASGEIGLDETGILTEPMYESEAERTVFADSSTSNDGVESEATQFEHQLNGGSKLGTMIVAVCLVFVAFAGAWMTWDARQTEEPKTIAVQAVEEKATDVVEAPVEEQKPEPAEEAKVEKPKPTPAPKVVAKPVKKPKPEVRAPAPEPRPKAKPKPVVGPGSLQVSTTPPVPIRLDGRSVGQTFRLRNASGTLKFGSGNDRKSNPFEVTVRYRVTGSEISFSVNSEPWAIVRGDEGIGLGKTPLGYQDLTNRAVFELLNPKKGLQQRITLRFIAR
jgi:hypothetical protein